MGGNCCKQNAAITNPRKPNEAVDKKDDLRISRSATAITEVANANAAAKEKRVVSLHGSARSLKSSQKAEYLHPCFNKQIENEHVIAGWPSWLTAVAGEAINGWLPRRADSFEKLDKIGQGTYSNVYRARDLEQKKVVALKKVRFDNLEPESVRFMAREIHILRQLNHPNVIKLEGLVTSRISCSLYLVFEYMEHDLAGLASHPNVKFTESQVKCYMRQLLQGLDHCHSRGVLHRDIKGSNLLIDNNGTLKIADYGLASFFDPHLSNPLTSRVVTLWYRPPELLLGAIYYGTAVDLWSTGCILAELYAGKPIMPGRTEVEQLHKIFKLCGSPSEDYWRRSKLPHSTIFKPQQPYRRTICETFKEFPAPALSLIETLLSIDPASRGSAASALESEFFTKKPMPCDPSSLPKYPPSKELDAKLFEEDSRRRAIRREKERKITESRAVPAPDANAELAASIQKRQIRSNSKSRSEKFSSHPEEIASGFPIDPPFPSREPESDKHKKASHSGPLLQRAALGKSFKQSDEPVKISDLIAARRSSMMMRFPGSFKEGSDRKKIKEREDGESSRKENATRESGPKDQKLHYSGPLVVPNVDQMLRDHDRHIQEAFRRARHEKSKRSTANNSLFFSRR